MRRRILLHRTLGGLLLLFLLLTVPALANERGVARTEFAPEPNVKRLALVIGNSDYVSSPLRNPVNDAVLMERTLKSLGFSVTALRNAEQREMERAIGEFGRRLRGGGIGLFYYAGHGMQVDGDNYLLPVDANPMSESDLRYEAVPVGKLLNQMEAAGNGMNIVILDACRNNPFARSFRSASKGLAQVSAPSGTFISYATGPGKVAADGEGGNGLYTEKLVAHLATPGLKLEEVFKRVRADVQRESMGKQVPWDSSSVTGDFFFLPSGVQPTLSTSATATTPQVASTGAIRADESAWRDIENSRDPEDFQFFLEVFPESPLAKTAKFKLRRLERKQPKAKAEQQQIAEEAKRLEEERKRLAAEKRQLAEAKRKAKVERKRQEELAAISQKKEKHSDANDSLSGSRITPEKIKDDYLAAGAKNTIQGYRLFVQRYENIPQAEFWVSLARKSIKDLQKRLSEPEPKEAKTRRIKQTYDKAVKEDTTEAYERFLQQFKDDPAARFRVRLAIKKLKRLGQSNTLLGRGEYEVIIKASEDTVSCGFLSFGCEGPLQLPLFDPDFHLKGYRRVKVFANRYPWIGSKIELKHGNQILVLASGKVTTSSSSNNLPPSERLVMRIGESRSFFKCHSRKTGEGAYRNFSVQESGELQFTVRDWDTYPPPQNYYSDNTGSYLLDVFVFDSTQLDGFKKFLRALIQQNPEDTEFSAGAQDFLKGALQHPKQESEVVWAEPINGMKFVIVPGGSFLMGSPSSEEGRRDNENLHLVHVGKFHLMETELTQAQWKSIMGSNPSHFMGEERPVERVSLDDVQKFIKKFNSRTGEHFRLPTEAEWEYAVRAGTKTTRYWGEEIGRNKANCKGCGNHFDGNQTTKVKSFASNDFGLYDMLGNVSEWTCSMYQNRYSGSEKKCANQVAAENLDYSIRGGSWSSDLSRVRSAYRTFQFPTGSSASRGFRLARDN